MSHDLTASTARAPSVALPPKTEAQNIDARSEPTQESVVSETSVAPPAGPGAGGEPPALSLCGDVKDALGRPIPSASGTLVTLGRGVSTDAEGKFCIDAPPGEHTPSVIAMGCRPLHRDVSLVPESPVTTRNRSGSDSGRRPHRQGVLGPRGARTEACGGSTTLSTGRARCGRGCGRDSCPRGKSPPLGALTRAGVPRGGSWGTVP